MDKTSWTYSSRGLRKLLLSHPMNWRHFPLLLSLFLYLLIFMFGRGCRWIGPRGPVLLCQSTAYWHAKGTLPRRIVQTGVQVVLPAMPKEPVYGDGITKNDRYIHCTVKQRQREKRQISVRHYQTSQPNRRICTTSTLLTVYILLGLTIDRVADPNPGVLKHQLRCMLIF